MPPAFVVAIDGPAGAGKSTVARRVADRLEGFRYLDTGAMYRAVTAYLLGSDNKEPSAEEMARAAEGLAWAGDRLLVHGRDVTDRIRSADVTAEVSRVAAVPGVRRMMRAKQRALDGRLVAEGRDMGSVVYPDARVKVYLDASLAERARRRHRQVPETSVDEYARRIERRDRLDSSREDSPLIVAEDAIVIDTSRLTIEEVVEKVVALVKESMEQGGDPAQQAAG